MERNILEWLERQAKERPQSVAFADVDGAITYAELLAGVQAAGSYTAAHASVCSPVAFFLEKSTLAIRGMIGAVAARCFYCVMDVYQPKPRLESILETLQPAFIVTDAAHAERAAQMFGDVDVEVVRIEDILAAPVDEEALCQRRSCALDIDPLYVNFTSGSTGTPKGVVVSHRSVIDFIPQFTKLFGITADDRIANQAPFDFDVSVKDIYSALYTGAQVHLIPREYFSIPVQLMDFLCERQVTVCTWAVSAMCFVSIMNAFDYRVPDTIRRVMFSGEVMPVKQLNVWRKHLPKATFVNVYGPTEITCNCTYYVIDREFEKSETIPIGKPFPNEKVFLLSEDDTEIAEQGTEGEICVSGTALALGYYNAPDKTASVFVQNPLNSAYLEPIYRTGDLGMWDADGNLVYMGRKDHQIKHMGQRIELGEIDAAAQAEDAVARACTLYQAKKSRIVMFYVGELEKDALSALLKEKLPAYMVPNKIIQVDAMPLTKNGKIDRNALAEVGGLQ